MFDEKFKEIRACAEIAQIPESIVGELAQEKDLIYTKIRAMTREGQGNFMLMGVLHCNPYSTGARPYKGGLRFHPNVTIDLLKSLAFDMTLKGALTRLPFGGAKFGVAIDPQHYTREELRNITEKIAEQLLLKNILNPDVYVPGPDVGTDSSVMFWIYNKVAELNVLAKLPNVAAVVTGKPIEHDGCPGREDATSRGMWIVLEQIFKLYPETVSQFSDPAKPTIAIQGFGNVGMNLAKLSTSIKKECFNLSRIIAVSDINGGIYNPDKLNLQNILEFYQTHKTFAGFPASEADQISNEELLSLPVDVLIPAAIEDQINAQNAHKIKAKIICEAANEAIAPAAQKHFTETDQLIVPGIVANAGGVVVSYLEWRRNRGERRHIVDMTEDFKWVIKELRRIITDAVISAHITSMKYKTSLVRGAEIFALTEISRQLQTKHPMKNPR